MIRAARADELERLRGIEFAAGEIFRSCGMDAIADDEPLAVTELALYQDPGRFRQPVLTDDRRQFKLTA